MQMIKKFTSERRSVYRKTRKMGLTVMVIPKKKTLKNM